MNPEIPKTLGEAMASEPLWLRSWVMVLVVVNLAALIFVVRKIDARWRIRPQPIAILAAFTASAVFMDWLYEHYGYVRLLGLAHVVFWGPVWAWILSQRSRFPRRTLFGGYVRVYLVIAGISLAIDLLDVVRYFAGDGELLGRWAG